MPINEAMPLDEAGADAAAGSRVSWWFGCDCVPTEVELAGLEKNREEYASRPAEDRAKPRWETACSTALRVSLHRLYYRLSSIDMSRQYPTGYRVGSSSG
ncbi:hypothetical protein PGT21_012687 [Puccinia graminis f. sp. tritici]|uniref:Uncharacterized protein n=1 Tax=Puccinia graminis f. sp. tritici TaxID=56615 RepID=A0A5B0NQG6_PUCGR|nr:hypothetical protein PGT21_012687 [Puccinia graminis f. sp. tritici]